jgi:cytochrome b561
MAWRNSSQNWGWLSVIIHWLTALAVFGLFGLGLWMVELDYYSPWYRTAPNIHRSIGVLLMVLTLGRLVWRALNETPHDLPGHKVWERKAAHITHGLIYVLLFAIMFSGYLISTADGRGVSVFGWFEIPAVIHGLKNQEDIAGEIHLVLAVLLITLVVVHAAGAFKHHFIDRDRTLRRMLGL